MGALAFVCECRNVHWFFGDAPPSWLELDALLEQVMFKEMLGLSDVKEVLHLDEKIAVRCCVNRLQLSLPVRLPALCSSRSSSESTRLGAVLLCSRIIARSGSEQ
jgi:hypothetical protein